MDVFLVPVGPDRYELYCEEHADVEINDDETPAHGGPFAIFKRLFRRFRLLLAEAERERRHGGPAPGDDRPSFASRVKRRSMRWIAEAIAEQRLLWQLRKASTATLVYPDDLAEADARGLLRRALDRDFERHRLWLAIDSVLMIGSIALVVLPGPNVVWYYFMFRVVGHYLSVRGARHGIVHTTWTPRASSALTTLRMLSGMPPADRGAGLDEVAAELGLEHLRSFFQKTAVR